MIHFNQVWSYDHLVNNIRIPTLLTVFETWAGNWTCLYQQKTTRPVASVGAFLEINSLCSHVCLHHQGNYLMTQTYKPLKKCTQGEECIKSKTMGKSCQILWDRTTHCVHTFVYITKGNIPDDPDIKSVLNPKQWPSDVKSVELYCWRDTFDTFKIIEVCRDVYNLQSWSETHIYAI